MKKLNSKQTPAGKSRKIGSVEELGNLNERGFWVF